jgi:Fe-S cluster assembly ATP-binding protein
VGILELDDVSLVLGGKTILDHVSIDFWEGHVHAVVGPNGAGKSTLAHAIMGLDGYRDITGDIRFQDESIAQLGVDERARRGITLAWQEPARFEGLTVQQFIEASAHEKTAATVDESLSLAGLEPEKYRSRAVDTTLSGGERKKVELASILAMQPRVVLLDEPDSGIDVASLNNIFAAITALRTVGATVILITHSPTVLEQAEHAFLLCCGKLVEKGAVAAIKPYFENRCIPCDHQNEPDAEGV